MRPLFSDFKKGPPIPEKVRRKLRNKKRKAKTKQNYAQVISKALGG